jgi:hypothetical protein
MADEFAKGLGIATAAGLGWMVLAGWYNTPEFFSNFQLLEPTPENLDLYGELAVVLRDTLLVFGILGMLTFWFVLPAVREIRAANGE